MIPPRPSKDLPPPRKRMIQIEPNMCWDCEEEMVKWLNNNIKDWEMVQIRKVERIVCIVERPM